MLGIEMVQHHLTEAAQVTTAGMKGREMKAWAARQAKAQRAYHLGRAKAYASCLFDPFCDYVAPAHLIVA